jgi:L-methionine (R)-S-oxide reductase
MSSPEKTIDCADDNHIQIIGKLKEYTILQEAFKELIKGETDLIANSANTAALIYQTLSDVNWAGFYFLKGNKLVLGPFQGKPACIRIALGKGVCGTAAQVQKTIIVPDVSKFPGHIACDINSNSEIVVPLIKDNQLLGVLDIDSPKLNRFDAQDQCCLERLMGTFVEIIVQS